MSVSELSPSTQNYLKTVWGLSEWSSEPVTPTLIAERTGLKLSSVSDAVRKLARQGLVDHAPYTTRPVTNHQPMNRPGFGGGRVLPAPAGAGSDR